MLFTNFFTILLVTISCKLLWKLSYEVALFYRPLETGLREQINRKEKK